MPSVRTLVPGRKTVTTAGTQVPLKSTTTKVRKLKIKALAANTGLIFLGVSDVDSSNGYQLAAGAEIDFADLIYRDGDLIDLNTVYIDSAVNGEGVCFVYVV